MRWLDQTDIGHDLQICPDCDRAYEVLDQFLGSPSSEQSHNWIDAVFNDMYYVAIRCPQCLETRHLCIQSLTATQFHNEKEKQ
ncbi:MAG: hypothetical protein OXH00_03915 [Candidatus Poribacteria bacterium]|nr:hypothetical protein [Candidatus Poribacteria bacterium]